MTKTFTTARPSFVRALATLKNLVLPKLDKQKLHMKIINDTLHRVHHLPIKCYTMQIVMVIMTFQKKFIFNTHNKNAHNFCISCSQVKLHLGWPRVFGPLRSPKNPWLAKMVKL